MSVIVDYDIEGNDDIVTCLFLDEDKALICNGTRYEVPLEPLTYRDGLYWAFIFLYIFLMLMSGVFSGLVLGLVSLDLTILKVLKDAGTPKIKKYATKISPLVERHHLLLVTLLLANAIAMEALPLCLDRVSDPVTAILVSVTTVLFFGEVIPQAVCSRYGLTIGATLTPLVYFLMGLFFVVAYPISKLLDVLLGKGHGTYYRRAELKALVNLHGKSHIDRKGHLQDVLTKDEIMIIQGALDMKDKTVANAMIPLDQVFMLSMDSHLNDATFKQIQKSYFSRIPVFENSRQNIQGVLMVKCLIRLNPSDAKPIRQLVHTKALPKPHFVSEDTSLFDVLNYFQTAKSHLSVVTKSFNVDSCDVNEKIDCSNFNNSVLGIITLEGIIEELLQKEIFKERDHFQSSLSSVLHLALAKLSLRQVPSSSQIHMYESPFTENRELLSSLTISYDSSLAGDSTL